MLHGDDVGPVSPPLALLAGHVHVLEEVHLELLEAVALARLAPPARHIERERAGVEAERPGPGEGGVELPDLVERLDVGHGVRARRPADRLLVDQADPLHVLEAGEGVVDAGRRELGLERARDGAVERVVDERGLAGARHAADDRERVERNPDRHVLEVVLARAHEDEVAPASAAEGRDRDRLASGDVTRGERARRPLELRLRAGEDDLAAPLARARPELEDRKSTRLNSSHTATSRMPSSA